MLSKIKRFDLNLLAVFVAIDEHRHITKAAKVLGITQPALSHALARLRSLLHDELFVKSSLGMVPTPKAEHLSKPIRSLLESFDQQVLGAETFSPKAIKRAFRIHTTDLIESLLLPSLLQILLVEAPGIQIVSRPMEFALPRNDLESGACDVAIAGFFGELPDGFYQQKLFSDSFVSAVRKDHPRLAKSNKLSLEDFCSEQHILVAPGGELHGKIDALLRKKKLQRSIVSGLNAFMSSAWIIPKTDCIFTAPSCLIKQINKAFPIKVLTPPISIPDITIVQTWHERNNRDPGHKWFREHIQRILIL